jgi:hypothetical protein
LSIDNPETVEIGGKRALNSVAGPAGDLFPAFCVQFVNIFFLELR